MLDNARVVWARYADQNARDVDNHVERLKTFSMLGALFSGEAFGGGGRFKRRALSGFCANRRRRKVHTMQQGSGRSRGREQRGASTVPVHSRSLRSTAPPSEPLPPVTNRRTAAHRRAGRRQPPAAMAPPPSIAVPVARHPIPSQTKPCTPPPHSFPPGFAISAALDFSYDVSGSQRAAAAVVPLFAAATALTVALELLSATLCRSVWP